MDCGIGVPGHDEFSGREMREIQDSLRCLPVDAALYAMTLVQVYMDVILRQMLCDKPFYAHELLIRDKHEARRSVQQSTYSIFAAAQPHENVP